MSLILDALARAERDKRREAQPLSSMLADAEPAAETPSRRRVFAWRVAGVSFVLFGAVALALSLWPSQRGSDIAATGVPDAASAPGAQKRAPRPVASTAQVSVPATATAAPPRAPSPVGRATESADNSQLRADVAALYAPVEAEPKQTPATDTPPAQETSVTTPPSVRAQEPTTASKETKLARAPRAEAAAGATDEEPVDLETLLREVRRESAVQGLAPNPVPVLSTLSKQFRDSVPTLMYLRHDYNPGSGSTVLLNGATLGAGDRTRGVEVREILPDSVICSYQGTDFRLRALNSWVNL